MSKFKVEKKLRDINKFLAGGNFFVLEQSFLADDEYSLTWKALFFESSLIVLQKEHSQAIKELFNLLHLPFEITIESNETLYDLFVRINGFSSFNHIQVNPIVVLIQEKNNHKKNNFMFFITLIVFGLWLTKLSFISQGLWALFQSSFGFLLIDLSINILVDFWSLYKTYYDDVSNPSNRQREMIYLIVKIIFNTVAISMTLLGISALALMISITIVRSSIDIIKEIMALKQNYLEYKTNLPLLKWDVTSKQILLKYNFGYMLHRNALLIDLLTAIALLSTLVAWTVLPSNLIVTVGLTALIIGIYAVKHWVLKINTSRKIDQLQRALSDLEEDTPEMTKPFEVTFFSSLKKIKPLLSNLPLVSITAR